MEAVMNLTKAAFVLGLAAPVGESEFHQAARLQLLLKENGCVAEVSSMGPGDHRLNVYVPESSTLLQKHLDTLAPFPVGRLAAHYAQVDDLRPLRGQPLEALTFALPVETPISLQVVKGFEVLTNAPLEHLCVEGVDIRDLSVIACMRSLKVLYLHGARALANLGPLAGLRLEALGLAGTSVVDLAPLRNMPLRWLYPQGTPITNLLDVAGMRLKHLDISSTRVADITPIKGMPLVQLSLSGTPVRDIGVVEGMPLECVFRPNRPPVPIDIGHSVRPYRTPSERSDAGCLNAYHNMPDVSQGCAVC
jgi:hypothetical protein